MMSRRAFLASSGAFLAGRVVGATSDEPSLRIGVISDVHIGRLPGWHEGDDEGYLDRAFAYFSRKNVDGVVIAGDLADWGLVAQLELVGVSWRKAFPDNRNAAGGKVEKLFVYGNHDLEGWKYGYQKRHKLPNSVFTEDCRISTNPARAWQRCFDEDYAPFALKTIKGYRFVLNNRLEYGEKDTFLEDHRAELEGERPFFYVQHFHPRGTCSAPWVWGQDAGHSTRALSRYPNAIALSGHSHTPLTDGRTFWQGEFTSVGTASLRYLISRGGRENSFVFGVSDPRITQMPPLDWNCQHGQIITVYDDRIVFERHDFHDDLPLGELVMPLPFDGSLSFEHRREIAETPMFPADAKVSVSERRGKDRRKNETDQVVVSFPNVLKPVRAYDYEVSVEVMDVDILKTALTKHVYSAGCLRGSEADVKTVECVFSKGELPLRDLIPEGGALAAKAQWKYRYAVRPCNCWGDKGPAITTGWRSM